jgi:hypothetical protein
MPWKEIIGVTPIAALVLVLRYLVPFAVLIWTCHSGEEFEFELGRVYLRRGQPPPRSIEQPGLFLHADRPRRFVAPNTSNSDSPCPNPAPNPTPTPTPNPTPNPSPGTP